jgi:hypothetical protein
MERKSSLGKVGQDQIAAVQPQKAVFQAFATNPEDKLILLRGVYIYI